MDTFCEYYNKGTCKSCTRIEVAYSEQISDKESVLKNALLGLYQGELLPTVTSSPRQFRNKAKFSVTGSLENPIIGLVGENELDKGREILDCPLHLPALNELAHALIPFIQSCKIQPYNIQNQKGEIKGIIVFYTIETNESYVRLILRSKESIDRIKKNFSTWSSQHPHVRSFSVNIQPIPHAILEGEEEVFLTSSSSIKVRFDDLDLGISPRGFVQTNQAIARRLYEQAALWVKELQPRKFLELFSGQGAFSFYVQKYVEETMGIEINPEAVKRANLNAEDNFLENVSFLAMDAKDIKDKINKMKPDILLVNPPRRGLGEGLDIVKNSGVQHLIYSSCSVETLKKDLLSLRDKYQIRKVRLFDMFPHTSHFETLVHLTLNDV